MHGPPGDVGTAEGDPPGVGLELAGELRDQRRLAGAVRADDGVDLAIVDREADVVGGDDPPELLAQVLGDEERHDSGAGDERAGSKIPARPRRAKSTMTISTGPRKSAQYSV